MLILEGRGRGRTESYLWYNNSIMSKVATQGYAASFHDVATRQLFGEDTEITPCDTFEEVFAHVVRGEADFGVVAVENSNYGPIKNSHDLLSRCPVIVCREITLRVEQCLLAIPGTRLEDITDIYSHVVALAQCGDYLAQYLGGAKLHEHPDTAGSAADVRAWGDRAKASIASRAAAEHYGLTILAAGIESDERNTTRFVAFRAA